MKLSWTDEEMEIIKEHGELCFIVAQRAMERNKVNFDDIERINEYSEEHKWGSNADRRYRKAAINKAIKKVAGNPLAY